MAAVDLDLPADGRHLPARWQAPARPRAAVLLLQAAGGLHATSRNAYLAEALGRAGFGCLMADLLTRHEDHRHPDARYNIALLARRLLAARTWLASQPLAAGLPLALFAAGTAAAAALRVAARGDADLCAVMCRSGRPDLAGAGLLRALACPTLLITGEHDAGNVAVNRSAWELLSCEKALVVVPGAGELFQEPGALEAVANHAVDWLNRRIPAPAAEQRG